MALFLALATTLAPAKLNFSPPLATSSHARTTASGPIGELVLSHAVSELNLELGKITITHSDSSTEISRYCIGGSVGSGLCSDDDVTTVDTIACDNVSFDLTIKDSNINVGRLLQLPLVRLDWLLQPKRPKRPTSVPRWLHRR